MSSSSSQDLKHSSLEIVESAIIVSESILGIIGIVLVLFTTRSDSSARNILVRSLCIADLILVCTAIVSSIINLTGGANSLGLEGCQLQTVFRYATSYGSALSLVAITLERYCSIILRMDLSSRGAMFLCGFLWTIIITIITTIIYLLAINNRASISLGSGITFCVIEFWGPASEAKAAAAITLSVVFLTVCIMISCYYQIYYKYKKAMKSKKKGGNKIIIAKKEQKLLRKSVILVGLFILSYTPFVVTVLYEIIAQQQSHPLLNGIAIIFIVANSAVNPYLLIFLDGRIRGEAMYIIYSVFKIDKNVKKLNHVSVGDGNNQEAIIYHKSTQDMSELATTQKKGILATTQEQSAEIIRTQEKSVLFSIQENNSFLKPPEKISASQNIQIGDSKSKSTDSKLFESQTENTKSGIESLGNPQKPSELDNVAKKPGKRMQPLKIDIPRRKKPSTDSLSKFGPTSANDKTIQLPPPSANIKSADSYSKHSSSRGSKMSRKASAVQILIDLAFLHPQIEEAIMEEEEEENDKNEKNDNP